MTSSSTRISDLLTHIKKYGLRDLFSKSTITEKVSELHIGRAKLLKECLDANLIKIDTCGLWDVNENAIGMEDFPKQKDLSTYQMMTTGWLHGFNYDHPVVAKYAIDTKLEMTAELVTNTTINSISLDGMKSSDLDGVEKFGILFLDRDGFAYTEVSRLIKLEEDSLICISTLINDVETFEMRDNGRDDLARVATTQILNNLSDLETDIIYEKSTYMAGTYTVFEMRKVTPRTALSSLTR